MSLLMAISPRKGISPTTPWSQGDAGRAGSLDGVAADSSTFAAIEYSGGEIYTASNPSGTWTKSSNRVPLAGRFIDSCSTYWIAGNTSSNICTATSATGTWTTRLTGSANFNSAIYSSTASLYIAVGNTGQLYTASNPTSTWTSRTSQFGTDAISKIYDNGSLIVAVGAAGKMSTSTDGTTWTARTSSFGTDIIRGAVYGGTTWVFVGDNSKVGTSSDPTSSVTQNTSTGIAAGISLKDVCYSDSEFVAVAKVGTNQLKAFETTTPAGSWTTKTIGFANNYPSLAANSSYFGAVSVRGSAGRVYGRAA